MPIRSTLTIWLSMKATSLNPLLRTSGRFDMAQARITLYSQLCV